MSFPAPWPPFSFTMRRSLSSPSYCRPAPKPRTVTRGKLVKYEVLKPSMHEGTKEKLTYSVARTQRAYPWPPRTSATDVRVKPDQTSLAISGDGWSLTVQFWIAAEVTLGRQVVGLCFLPAQVRTQVPTTVIRERNRKATFSMSVIGATGESAGGDHLFRRDQRASTDDPRRTSSGRPVSAGSLGL